MNAPDQMPFAAHEYDDRPDELPADHSMSAMSVDLDERGLPAKVQADSLTEETAEELIEAVGEKFPRALQDTRGMLRKMALISGHQSGYEGSPKIDYVDEIRDAEKQNISETILALIAEHEANGGKWRDEKRDVPREPHKCTTSEVRAVAALLNCAPKDVWYPRHIACLPLKEKVAILRNVLQATKNETQAVEQDNGGVEQKRPNLAKIWNQLSYGLREIEVMDGDKKKKVLVRDLKDPHALPSFHSMRYDGTPTTYRRPGAYNQPGLTGIVRRQKDQSGVEKSSDWMKAAEEHRPILRKKKGGGPGELEQVITQCGMTGESLIIRGGSRRRSWRIGPSISPKNAPYAMGLKAARLVVDAAAVLALQPDQLSSAYGFEMLGAQVEGTMPEFVHEIAKDGDAWAILAAHTEHPVWSRYAKFLLMLRDTLYFQLDDHELRQASKIGEKIADELRKSYPHQFFDPRLPFKKTDRIVVQAPTEPSKEAA